LDINILIKDVVLRLKLMRRNDGRHIDYNNYVDSLSIFFDLLAQEVSFYSSAVSFKNLYDSVAEIYRRLSYGHLPKKTFSRLSIIVKGYNISDALTKALISCEESKDKYYKDVESSTIESNNRDYNEEVVLLQKKIITLDKKINRILNGSGFSEVHADLTKQASAIFASLQQEVSNLQANTQVHITKQIENIRAEILSSKTNLESLVGDLESYKRIVNRKSEEEIAKYYAEKAISEKKSYWLTTTVSILIIFISLSVAWSGLHDYYETYVIQTSSLKVEVLKNTAEYAKIYLIFRLLFSFLLFLTVVYTSRIAYRAYVHWRHSEGMKLKLSSLRPFINQLTPEDRRQIYKDLIPDYFNKDAGMVDEANEKFKDIPTNISAVAMKAIEQIGSGGGSSEGKKGKKDSDQSDK
jgi:hypothetical protein